MATTEIYLVGTAPQYVLKLQTRPTDPEWAQYENKACSISIETVKPVPRIKITHGRHFKVMALLELKDIQLLADKIKLTTETNVELVMYGLDEDSFDDFRNLLVAAMNNHNDMQTVSTPPPVIIASASKPFLDEFISSVWNEALGTKTRFPVPSQLPQVSIRSTSFEFN